MAPTNSSLLWASSIDPDLCQIALDSDHDNYDYDFEDVYEMNEISELDMFLTTPEEEIRLKKARKERWLHMRLSWVLHEKKLSHENEFDATYGMSIQSFHYLVSILEPFLERKSGKSRSLEVVSGRIIIAVAMRYLRGGHVLDLKNVYGLSKSEVYNCRDCFLKAVLDSDYLEIRMPDSAEEWERVRSEFQSKSTDRFIDGCVGALDGFLQKIICPRHSEVGANVECYRSGHYLCFGLNCQAMVDASLKFMFFGVVAPGSTNDNLAIERAQGLMDIINLLPDGLFVVGDAAYSLAEHLLIPFIGSQAEHVEKDVYNYYISQLRIRVEMAFGLFVKRFGILRTAIATSVKTATKLMMVCARIHNFLLDRTKIEDDDTEQYPQQSFSNRTRVRNSPHGMSYLPTIADSFEYVEGYSQIRQSILERIMQQGRRRPLHNIVRNATRIATSRSESDLFEGIDRQIYQPR